MTTPSPYTTEQPARADIDALQGAAVLDFGTNWCGFCKGASPKVEEALAAHGGALQHIKVEDGSGRPLGRSFGIKLWPTLVVLQDGREVARVVRPTQAAEVATALAALAPTAPSPAG
ncbi:MAG: thioredoxin [Comamonadaceae bacterium]|nr:MAG: thioredoxin [Comamonadaceae bacterium]